MKTWSPQNVKTKKHKTSQVSGSGIVITTQQKTKTTSSKWDKKYIARHKIKYIIYKLVVSRKIKHWKSLWNIHRSSGEILNGVGDSFTECEEI